MLGNGFVYLDYDLSVLREDDVLQRVLHQQGEVHLIHGHVRQCRLLKRGRNKNCYLPPPHQQPVNHVTYSRKKESALVL